MKWYLVEFPQERENEYVNGVSEEDVRGFLRQAYEESELFSVSRETVENATITELEELDGEDVSVVQERLGEPDTPFRAVDRTRGSKGSVLFFENRSNTSGSLDMYQGGIPLNGE